MNFIRLKHYQLFKVYKREINLKDSYKCRGKSLYNYPESNIGLGEWVIGYFYQDTTRNKYFIKVEDNRNFVDVEITPDTLGQCTRIKLKDETRVFEKDIVGLINKVFIPVENKNIEYTKEILLDLYNKGDLIELDDLDDLTALEKDIINVSDPGYNNLLAEDPKYRYIEVDYLQSKHIVSLNIHRFWLKGEEFGYEGEELISPSCCILLGNIFDNPEILKDK